MWHFSQANSDHIKEAINLFDRESSLNNLNVNEHVFVFNETIMNIMSNFAPNEFVTCDDQDPFWMNRFIKNLIVAINDFHKKFVLPSINIGNLLIFKILQNQLIQSIQTVKQKYFNKISKKLCDPLTSTKCYWSLLKTILNEKKYHEYLLFFITTSMSLILKKREKFLILFSLINALSYQTTAYYHLN